MSNETPILGSIQRKPVQSADCADFAAYIRIRPWRSQILYSFGNGRSARSLAIEYGRRLGTGSRNAIDRFIQEDYIETKRENAQLRGRELRSVVGQETWRDRRAA